MYRLSLVLVLLSYSAFGEYFDEWQYDVGVPGTSQSGNTKAECKKDLLLIVDTSYSIGKSDFEANVQPFLKNLVKDPQLNVGPDGTHVGLILFSSEQKTRSELRIGQIEDANQLAEYIDKLKYSEISGDRTRTELALDVAKQTFPKASPGNNRPNIEDAVILITDGEPHGKRNSLELTQQYAKDLKGRNVLMVVAGVGRNSEDPKFQEVLINLATSQDFFFKAQFDHLDDILDKLVAKSCTKPGECSCVKGGIETTVFVKEGQSKALAVWPKPEYDCATGGDAIVESIVVNPPRTSPSYFAPGTHVISYTYKFQGDVNVTCPVTINVIGQQCRGKDFNSAEQECCCGTIYPKRNGFACCGPDYIDLSSKKCCNNANVVPKGQACLP